MLQAAIRASLGEGEGDVESGGKDNQAI